MNQNLKTIIGFVLLSLGLVVSLIAQANLPVPPLPPEGQANILTAMYDTILHNPSSLFVVIILCVAAWLMDELPFINSKYVMHFTTLIGGSIYWMFCHPGNVPKTFPYAWPVLACIGVICGFVAGVLHKQIIGRLIEYVKGRIPGSDTKPADPNPPSASRLPLILFCGFLSFGLIGCAGSYDRQVFRIETAALGTADGAMRGYAVYYKSATNNPAAFKRSLAELNTERDRVCALSVQVGASGELVEQLRQGYKTNSAMRPALEAGVITLTANMGNILGAVTNIIHINPK